MSSVKNLLRTSNMHSVKRNMSTFNIWGLADSICNAEVKVLPVRITVCKAWVKNDIFYLIKLLNKITIITEGKVLSSGINKVTQQLESYCTLLPAFHLLSTCFQEGNLLQPQTVGSRRRNLTVAKWMSEGLQLKLYLKEKKLLNILYLKDNFSWTLRTYLSLN